MCELFAFSSRQPSTLNYSLFEFAKHGGLTHSNKSGWGIAYHHHKDAFLIKEPEPASDSEWVKFIGSQKLKSDTVIAHVRLATVGTPLLRNTHPFKRELGGYAHIFAHNGTLKGLHENTNVDGLFNRPMGETDSELSFCILLERMRHLWVDGEIPGVEDRLEVFRQFCTDMKTFGSANFIYTDGDLLFAHGHRRIYEENQSFTEAKPPGLSMRNCLTCQEGEEHWSCNGLDIELGDPKSVLFASVPLGSTGWHPLEEGAVMVVKGGEVIAEASSMS